MDNIKFLVQGPKAVGLETTDLDFDRPPSQITTLHNQRSPQSRMHSTIPPFLSKRFDRTS